MTTQTPFPPSPTILILGGAYQNKTALARRLYPAMERVEQLHRLVRQTLASGQDPLTLLVTLRGKCIICDEVGCGVVPLDPQEEQWREAVGRLCCALAAEAAVVIRVVAGLPQYLKGAPSTDISAAPAIPATSATPAVPATPVMPGEGGLCP